MDTRTPSTTRRRTSPDRCAVVGDPPDDLEGQAQRWYRWSLWSAWS